MKLLTSQEVGKALGFRPRTINRWCKEGYFPSAQKVGRVWRIDEDDDRLLKLLHIKSKVGR